MGHYDAIIEKIYRNALVLLAKKGLLVENKTVLKKLEGIEGISFVNGRVCFTEVYTDAFVKRFQAGKEYTAPKKFTASCLGHANHIVDWNDCVRPITEADNNDMARLIDAMADWGITGSAPGIPQDVPMPLQGISQFVSSAKNSRGAPQWAGYKSIGTDLLLKQCMDIMGLQNALGIHLISPLKMTGNEVDCTLEMFMRFPELSVAVGDMPIIGLSTPATIVSGFTVAVAEVLGGGMVFDVLGAKELSMSVNLYPFDMKYMSFIYGTPTNIAINRIEIEINKTIFKTQIVSKCLNTMSQLPNQQAASQKAMYAGIMAEYGKRNFTGAGGLSMDEVFSPVQLMVDREILDALRMVYGMDDTVFDDEHLLLDVILENTDDDYISEYSTVEHYRENQWNSRLFPSYQLQQWISAGKPDVHRNAKEQAQKLIRENPFELDRDKARALDEIYDWARAHMDQL